MRGFGLVRFLEIKWPRVRRFEFHGMLVVPAGSTAFVVVPLQELILQRKKMAAVVLSGMGRTQADSSRLPFYSPRLYWPRRTLLWTP
jgi:hypothetical protein